MRNELEKLEKVLDKTIDIASCMQSKNKESVYFDKWNLRDVLAHLNGWNWVRIKELGLLLNGKRVEIIHNFDKFNAQSLKERKTDSWETIYEEFVQSSKDLLIAFRKIPEKLINRKIWADKSTTPLKWIKNDISHLEEHLRDIKKKFRN